MAMSVIRPNVTSSVKHYTLGEGSIVKNFITSAEEVGCTSGGSSFDVERVIRDIAIDGIYGKQKNYRLYDSCIAKLTVNYLEITTDSLSVGLPVVVTDGSDKDGSYHKMIFDLELKAEYVLSDITFKGRKYKDDASGTSTVCAIILKNALNIDSFSLTFASKADTIATIVYTGFYSYADPITPPYEIRDYGF